MKPATKPGILFRVFLRAFAVLGLSPQLYDHICDIILYRPPRQETA